MWEIFEYSWSFAGFLTIFTGGLALSYELSPQFRYCMKFVTYIIYVSSFCLFLLPIFIWRPKEAKNVLIGAPIISALSTVLGVKWDLEGTEILEKDFPCIIVCNHQSIIDFLGIVALLCGTIFIDRSNAAECKAKLNASVQELQEKKVKLWIFPEGTRNKGSTLLPFKKGAFHLALQNKLPIVPVVISPYTFVNDEKRTFNSGRVTLKVLPLIDTTGYEVADIDKLVELTQNVMTTEYQRLSLLAQKSAEDENESSGSRNEPILNQSHPVPTQDCNTN